MSFTGTTGGTAKGILRYIGASSSYSVPNFTGVAASIASDPTIAFGAGDRVPSQSNARLTTYQRTSGDFTFLLQMFNAGSGNDQLQLTYSSVGLIRQGRTSLSDYPTYTTSHTYTFSYGFPTASLDSVPSGNLTFTGIAIGEATYLRDQPGAPVYRVSGTISITTNPTGGTASGTLKLTGTDDRTSATADLGTYSIMLTTDGLQVTSPAGLTTGTINYAFYGPTAQELGGAGGVMVATTSGNLYIALAFASKR